MDLENCIKYLLSDAIDLACFFFVFQLSEGFQIFHMALKTGSDFFFPVHMIFQMKRRKQ